MQSKVAFFLIATFVPFLLFSILQSCYATTGKEQAHKETGQTSGSSETYKSHALTQYARLVIETNKLAERKSDLTPEYCFRYLKIFENVFNHELNVLDPTAQSETRKMFENAIEILGSQSIFRSFMSLESIRDIQRCLAQEKIPLTLESISQVPESWDEHETTTNPLKTGSEPQIWQIVDDEQLYNDSNESDFSTPKQHRNVIYFQPSVRSPPVKKLSEKNKASKEEIKFGSYKNIAPAIVAHSKDIGSSKEGIENVLTDLKDAKSHLSVLESEKSQQKLRSETESDPKLTIKEAESIIIDNAKSQICERLVLLHLNTNYPYQSFTYYLVKMNISNFHHPACKF